MFQKLRSDLASRLAGIRILLVNAEGFANNGHGGNGIAGSEVRIVDSLSDVDVTCLAYSESRSHEISTVAEALGIELHQSVSDPDAFYDKIKSEYSVPDSAIALIFRDYSDLGIAGRVEFAVATPDAPLEVRAKSSYPSYCNGSYSIYEIARLIVTAKTYPGGWSE